VTFGEVFLEERDTTWNTPYKFNGKELDEETGLYYYGARYYNPRTSLWISVDPLAEKYAGISSYAYALNNPVKLIDPTGMDPDWIKNDKTKKYEWRNEVTSKSNTPTGYSYIGKEDNDIVKDLGYSSTPVMRTMSKKGVIHADVEKGDGAKHIASYTVGHAIRVDISTTVQVVADVTYNYDKNVNMSKMFNGLSEKISMVVTTSSEEKLTTTAEVKSFMPGGGISFSLGEPSFNTEVRQAGAFILYGNVNMTSEQAQRGTSFPSLNISGTFFRETTSGPAFVMPSALSGQLNLLAPLKYSQFIPVIMPNR
jgi:RHS repeat-associated protein